MSINQVITTDEETGRSVRTVVLKEEDGFRVETGYWFAGTPEMRFLSAKERSFELVLRRSKGAEAFVLPLRMQPGEGIENVFIGYTLAERGHEVEQPEMSLKEYVGNDKIVRFVRFFNGDLWYRTDNGFEFPVPINEAGNATFMAEDKSVLFMRYIRKHLDLLAEAKKIQDHEKAVEVRLDEAVKRPEFQKNLDEMTEIEDARILEEIQKEK